MVLLLVDPNYVMMMISYDICLLMAHSTAAIRTALELLAILNSHRERMEDLGLQKSTTVLFESPDFYLL